MFGDDREDIYPVRAEDRCSGRTRSRLSNLAFETFIVRISGIRLHYDDTPDSPTITACAAKSCPQQELVYFLLYGRLLDKVHVHSNAPHKPLS